MSDWITLVVNAGSAFLGGGAVAAIAKWRAEASRTQRHADKNAAMVTLATLEALQDEVATLREETAECRKHRDECREELHQTRAELTIARVDVGRLAGRVEELLAARGDVTGRHEAAEIRRRHSTPAKPIEAQTDDDKER